MHFFFDLATLFRGLSYYNICTFSLYTLFPLIFHSKTCTFGPRASLGYILYGVKYIDVVSLALLPGMVTEGNLMAQAST